MSEFQPRDLVKIVDVRPKNFASFGKIGQHFLVERVLAPGGDHVDLILDGVDGSRDARRFELVSRPDADGWYTWAGGENPVPGRRVDVRWRDETARQAPDLVQFSDTWIWRHADIRSDIVAFRIVEVLEDAGPQVASPTEAAPTSIAAASYWYPSYLMAEIREAGGVIDDEDGQVTWPNKAKITLSPDAVQEGDLVRVSFDIRVGETACVGALISKASFSRWAEQLNARYELLERPEKPLAVGDEVSWPKVVALGHIKSIDGDEAWVKWTGRDRDYSTVKLGELKRA